LREIRQEIGLIAAILLVAALGLRLHGNGWLFLATAATAYVGWHAVNIGRLLVWLGRAGQRTPVSFGIWERIFDRLQANELRGRRRRRELRDFVRRLRLVIGGISDAVVLLDDRGRVRWFNPAGARLLGLRLQGVSKRPINEVLRQSPVAEQIAVSANFGPIDLPSPVNGAVVLRVEVSELEGTGQRLLIARDITKTHNLERSRRDFVANVSHELRTPLTVFRGYLETLADDLDRMPDLAEPIAQLNQQSTRMQGLVEDLLDLSRLESTDRASFEVTVAVPEMIRSIVPEARLLASEGQREIVERVDQKLRLAGDASILRMAFSNLVFNAVKHAGDGARIVVEWTREDDGATFRVRDNGRGIPAQHLSRLTERFYRVNPSRSRADGGTGLGLAIVKHALERHDAVLQIESAPGQGASFTCHFSAERVVSATGYDTSRRGQPRHRQTPAH